jgi:hypothetical protein
MLSALNSLCAIALNDFIPQRFVSILNAVISAGTGVLGSIQLYMKINEKFLKQGYYIFNIIDYNSLKYISNEIYKLSKIYFNNKRLKIPNKKIFFNNIHRYLPVKDLNEFRIFVYNNLNKIKNFREKYFLLGKEYLDESGRIKLVCNNSKLRTINRSKIKR